MTSDNRTADWPRLMASGFLKVADEGDQITVSSGLPRSAWGLFVVAGLIYLAGFAAMGFAAAVGLFIWLFILIPLWQFYVRFGRSAYRVRYGAEALEFFGPVGNRLGYLRREAMQQIAVEEEKTKARDGRETSLFYHWFYSDNGYIPAFPQENARTATMRNNLLMAAFAQPVGMLPPRASGGSSVSMPGGPVSPVHPAPARVDAVPHV